MVINIKNCRNDMPTEFALTFQVKLPPAYNSGENNSNIHFKGMVSVSNGKYLLKGTAHTATELQCCKCLELFEHKMTFDVNEVYVKGEASEEEIHFEGQEIDIDSAVISGIIVNLPMKAVCREDCKGLCYKCGQNLNVSECECDRSYVNPFFEDL